MFKKQRLIPDPPLGDFPVPPDGHRWRIEPRDRWAIDHGWDDMRRVYIDKFVEKSFLGYKWTKWESVLWGVWKPEEGLGDFSKANINEWHRTKGLASVMGHTLKNFYKVQQPKEEYLDVHGVSIV